MPGTPDSDGRRGVHIVRTVRDVTFFSYSKALFTDTYDVQGADVDRAFRLKAGC